MTLRERLLHFLRVPPAPSAPAGDAKIRVFRAARNYFRYRLVGWLLKQTGAVVGLLVGVLFLRGAPAVLPPIIEIGAITLSEGTILTLLSLIEAAAIAGFIVQAAFSLALLRLDFEQRWYIVSDRSLRIREGLVRLHEKTMTFANIQQLTIRQGPLQRLLRIADLQVRTAGGGGSSGSEEGVPKQDLHVAYFRGVDNAEHIRDAIRERLRQQADAGLGDPDDIAHHLTPARLVPASSGLLEAAVALRNEAKLLRVAHNSKRG
ncbi:MAG: PH domain-containing protein [Longimicrobiales bacterium]